MPVVIGHCRKTSLDFPLAYLPKPDVPTDRYSEQRAELTESGDPSTRKAKIEMYQIGG
jgi:hypothetical protein